MVSEVRPLYTPGMMHRTVVIVSVAIVVLSAHLLGQTQRMTPTAPGSMAILYGKPRCV